MKPNFWNPSVAIFLAVSFSALASPIAVSQTVLDARPQFDDPRMAQLRAVFSENFGDIRDLSFSINARVWPNERTSFNITSSFSDNVNLIEFVGKLGGRVKNKNSEFSLVFDLYSAKKNCKNEGRCANAFDVKIYDLRDKSVLKSYGSKVSCPASDATVKNSRYLICPIKDELMQEILLNLADG